VKWSHLFLPHPETHKKAHLISLPALFVYCLMFLFLQFGIKDLSILRPDVLGVSANIDVKELIKLTNEQRAKNGLPALAENSQLDAAAQAKAQNMFAENYWAHYSPSGKDPWGFILGAGYKFSYAGENLARNFNTSSEVVDAWMASPSHKENIVNTHYTDVGMAVAYGKLNGQDTVLVVQEFGSPVEYVAQAKPTSAPVVALAQTPAPTVTATLVPTTNPTPTETAAPVVAAANLENPPPPQPSHPVLIDSFQLGKTLSLSLLGFVGLLLAVDLIVLRRRAVAHVSGRHWSHFALIAVAASTIAVSAGGSVL
jgi:hypothetical protein